MKPVKHAISVVIEIDDGLVLFALRSQMKDSYPLTWSLPSHYVKPGESPGETVKRIGKGKLGVELEILELLNEGSSERDEYILFMHDYKVKILEGVPALHSTDYIELKWGKPEVQLHSMSVMGDCCRLYKEYLELPTTNLGV